MGWFSSGSYSRLHQGSLAHLLLLLIDERKSAAFSWAFLLLSSLPADRRKSEGLAGKADKPPLAWYMELMDWCKGMDWCTDWCMDLCMDWLIGVVSTSWLVRFTDFFFLVEREEIEEVVVAASERGSE